MDHKQYETETQEIERANKSHIVIFEKWLQSRNLSEKTIRGHVNNVDFYINHYLSYYEPQTVDMGCYCIDGFLGEFFIRKAMWSTRPQIKANAASIKKFYKCMLENGIVEKEDYSHLCEDIQDGMDEWLAAMDSYEKSMEEIDMFDDLLD